MSRRKILLGVGAFTALVLVALVAFVLTRPRPVIDQATAARIERGMTEAEVDAIIGAPEGNYNPRDYLLSQKSMDVFLTMPNTAKRKKWIAEPGMILVCFDAQGKALGAFFFPASW